MKPYKSIFKEVIIKEYNEIMKVNYGHSCIERVIDKIKKENNFGLS